MAEKWKKIFIRKNCDLPTCCAILSAYPFVWQAMKEKQEYLFGYFKDRDFHYYARSDVDERMIGRKLYQKYFNSPAKIIKTYRSGLIFLKQTKKKTQYFKKLLNRRSSSRILKKAIRIFGKDFDFVSDNFSIRPWWALEAWQHDFEDVIEKLIGKRHLEDKRDVLISSLLQPWKTTALMKVGREVFSERPVEALVEKYQFLRSWTPVWYKSITDTWVKSAAQSPVKSRDLFSKTQLFKILKPTRAQMVFFTQAPYVVFFKDWRDDLRRQHVYDWNFLFVALAEYFSADYVDLGYFTLDELSTAIEDGCLDQNKLRARKGHEFILTVDAGTSKFKILTTIPLRYRRAIEGAENLDTKITTVTGIVAQPGKISGPVRIIKNFHDIKKVQPGEVLVANTTHPNYLMGMRMAAAFITDEGGVASHAAIVAREMKKPCIVGTKIATQVFKDGDLVEVDAGRGCVIIIKRGDKYAVSKN
jgi:phosphoenolpyruvate synthase/pyruvate phosphate dikinase